MSFNHADSNLVSSLWESPLRGGCQVEWKSPFELKGPPDGRLEATVKAVQAGHHDDLKRLISTHGVVVEVEIDLDNTVVDGLKRVAIARVLGLERVPVFLHPSESSGRQLARWRHRRGNPLAEYRAIERMRDRLMNDREIAAALGIHPSAVNQITRVANIHPELIQALRDGRITYSAARSASYLTKEEQERLLERLHERGSLQGSDVEAIAEGAPPVAVRSNVRRLVRVARGRVSLEELVGWLRAEWASQGGS